MTDFWDDFRIKQALEDVEARVHKDGMAAVIPSGEETIALHMAVCILFRHWYEEFYK